jgi:hypothetical protein
MLQELGGLVKGWIHPNCMPLDIKIQKRILWRTELLTLCVVAVVVSSGVQCKGSILGGELEELSPVKHPV